MKKNVQVPMFDTTLMKINGLKDLLRTNNRSEIVKTSVDITDMVVRTLAGGGHVILQDSTGEKQEIVIPGIS